jgi:CelD/BcsL family acetyltransferase involved in cellulose biosynthesis
MLHLNNEPVAMEYQLVADGNAYALRSDFDARYDHISPGSYLSRHLLERLFGMRLQRYLMGPGQNLYKYRWTEQAEPVLEGAVFSNTPNGRALAAWTLNLKPALRKVRDWLEPPLSNRRPRYFRDE